MTRVVAVSPVGHFGGAEVLLLDVLAGLTERGHAALLVTCGGDENSEQALLAKARGVEVSAAPGFRLRDVRGMFAAATHLRRVAGAFGGEVLHCNHPHGAVIGLLACLDVPLSVQLLDPPARHDPVARAMTLVRADFVSISDTTTDVYRPHLRRARSLTTIRPGRDLDGFRTAAAAGDAASVLRRAGLNPGASPLVVMVGRLQTFKGIFRLIDAAVLVPEATFVHIGPDAPTEVGTRERAQAAICAKGLSGRVGLAGPVPFADLAATVARAGVLAHLAEGETFGLALVEAMSVGTPPVAIAGPGPNEILREGGGVLLFDGAASTVSAAIRDLLSNPIRLRALAARARQNSCAFGLEQMTDTYETWFAQMSTDRATA